MFCNSSIVIKVSALISCLLLLIWYAVDDDVPRSPTTWITSHVDIVPLKANITKSTTEAYTSTTTIIKPVMKVNIDHRPFRRCKLVVCSIGNLGNQIWEYMSLFVVWKRFLNSNYTPYIEERMWTTLKVLFPKLSIMPTWNGICNIYRRRIIPRNNNLSDYERWFTNDRYCQDIFLEEYSSRYDDVIEYGVDEIRKEMKYDEGLVQDCQMVLQGFKTRFGLENETVTFIGLHYRGTDYVNHLNINYGNYNPKIPDYHYYTKAMDYFMKKYQNIIFILLSIDIQWLNTNAQFIESKGKNVIVNPYINDRDHDLVLLSNCNHSIINYGSYGVTGALFNGGETIVYDLKLPLDHRGSTLAMGIAEILENWYLLH
ncbi:hypothetical protein Trydic_g21489 [Trypoxylus dichotomus]